MCKIFMLLFLCVAVTGCSTVGKPTGVALNGLSHHINASNERNEVNTGIGLTFADESEIGVYRNSRVMAQSHSAYYLKSIGVYGVRLGAGAAIYDNKGHYDWALKPMVFVGKRFALSRRLSVNVRYMPSDLITANVGIKFGR